MQQVARDKLHNVSWEIVEIFVACNKSHGVEMLSTVGTKVM